MPVVKLNARNITTLPAIGGVRTDYRDELLPGFFLRVTPQGTRSFGIVYTTRDGRRRRCTLGPVGPLGLSDARAQAKRLRDLRLHDFRRTAASLMTGMGISRLTVKKILNHAERDVTAIYDRHSYDAEKRIALEVWGRRLDGIVSGKPPKSQVAELSVLPQQATRS